jgi:hypothetical protein
MFLLLPFLSPSQSTVNVPLSAGANRRFIKCGEGKKKAEKASSSRNTAGIDFF